MNLQNIFSVWKELVVWEIPVRAILASVIIILVCAGKKLEHFNKLNIWKWQSLYFVPVYLSSNSSIDVKCYSTYHQYYSRNWFWIHMCKLIFFRQINLQSNTWLQVLYQIKFQIKSLTTNNYTNFTNFSMFFYTCQFLYLIFFI